MRSVFGQKLNNENLIRRVLRMKKKLVSSLLCAGMAVTASKESIKYKKLKKLKDDLKIMVEDIEIGRAHV